MTAGFTSAAFTLVKCERSCLDHLLDLTLSLGYLDSKRGQQGTVYVLDKDTTYTDILFHLKLRPENYKGY